MIFCYGYPFVNISYEITIQKVDGSADLNDIIQLFHSCAWDEVRLQECDSKYRRFVYETRSWKVYSIPSNVPKILFWISLLAISVLEEIPEFYYFYLLDQLSWIDEASWLMRWWWKWVPLNLDYVILVTLTACHVMIVQSTIWMGNSIICNNLFCSFLQAVQISTSQETFYRAPPQRAGQHDSPTLN